MTILILDNYDSFTYNLYQLVQSQTQHAVLVRRNNELDWQALLQLAPERIILSPGPGHPAKPSDFGICRDVLQRYFELNCPILGVCLGHQGLAHYFGGEVVPAPQIMHGKTSEIRIIKESPLFQGLPNPLSVMRYHSWTVDRTRIPSEFEIIAETIEEPSHQTPLVMAIQHKTQPLFGVQFHPESVGTPQGAQILRNFLIAAPLKPERSPRTISNTLG